MTFKDLRQLVQSSSSLQQQQLKLDRLMQRLRGKEFWYWSQSEHKSKDRIYHGNCCFNHIIGLPRKDGKRKPIFDYEYEIYKALVDDGYLNSVTYGGIRYPFKCRHLWVKKATGLGITEFMLRFMAWFCLRNDDCRDTQMVIVTAPNQDLAINLIKRMKGLFEPHGIYFDTKETVLELNGCSIQAYPSNHIDAFRSLTNPKFILIDEADFLPKFQQDDVRHVAERYIAKSDPFIVMVSTPNAPNGLFERIEKEPLETCIYKKVFLDYTYGLEKIYSQQEIEKAKASPSFEREYCLKYLGLVGNVFSQLYIENCQKISYDPLQINPNSKKSIGIDTGFGSSNFAIVATQLVDNKIQVIHAEEYPRPIFTEMIEKIWQLKNKLGHVSNIYVDAANPEVIRSLKQEFGESYNERYIKERFDFSRKYGTHIEDSMFIVPVPFSVEGAKMLQHAKWLLEETDEDGSSLIAISII